MRRAFSLLLALLLLALPLAACTAEREEAEDGLQIVATNFPLYDFARRVGRTPRYGCFCPQAPSRTAMSLRPRI